MGIVDSYKLRLRRKRWHLRAFRRRHDLRPVVDRTSDLRRPDILLFCTLRNERVRLPWFLDFYRKIGIGHFFFVDNDSGDGSREYLAQQPDVSLWTTKASYARSKFGVDWLNLLLRRHAHGHWALTVDVDEFLVYPFSDTRPLRALTDWLDTCAIRSLGAMMVDMYPKGRIADARYAEGQDPLEIASWFDGGNYQISRNPDLRNLWIQGGPRARMFFADAPSKAPALNKVPLVKWHRNYAYVSSTHMLLPRGLNQVYDGGGGEKASGCLLHAKFIDTFGDKATEEAQRQQHYGREYAAYDTQPVLWTRWSEQYVNWRQLEMLGLMSKGNWA